MVTGLARTSGRHISHLSTLLKRGSHRHLLWSGRAELSRTSGGHASHLSRLTRGLHSHLLWPVRGMVTELIITRGGHVLHWSLRECLHSHLPWSGRAMNTELSGTTDGHTSHQSQSRALHPRLLCPSHPKVPESIRISRGHTLQRSKRLRHGGRGHRSWETDATFTRHNRTEGVDGAPLSGDHGIHAGPSMRRWHAWYWLVGCCHTRATHPHLWVRLSREGRHGGSHGHPGASLRRMELGRCRDQARPLLLLPGVEDRRGRRSHVRRWLLLSGAEHRRSWRTHAHSGVRTRRRESACRRGPHRSASSLVCKPRVRIVDARLQVRDEAGIAEELSMGFLVLVCLWVSALLASRRDGLVVAVALRVAHEVAEN